MEGESEANGLLGGRARIKRRGGRKEVGSPKRAGASLCRKKQRDEEVAELKAQEERAKQMALEQKTNEEEAIKLKERQAE